MEPLTIFKKSRFLISLITALPLLCFADPIKPEESLKRLIEGNARYASDSLERPNHDSDRREAIVSKQKPFAVIVGCSDSRVPPEIIFDQGLGDLFVVRVAGNVVSPVELDSIEYATLYLCASTVMVLGHEGCGAVKAVLADQTKDIEAVANLIRPAIQKSKDQPGDPLENAVKENVRLVVQQIRNSPTLRGCEENKTLNIVGGYYNLKSGKVELVTNSNNP